MSQEEEGRIGVFPSWSRLYWVVVVYGILVIGILTLLSRVFDPGRGP